MTDFGLTVTQAALTWFEHSPGSEHATFGRSAFTASQCATVPSELVPGPPSRTRSGRGRRQSPRTPVKPTGMIEFALGRICSMSARYQGRVGICIGDADCVGAVGPDDAHDDLARFGRDGIRDEFRFDRGAGGRDGAVNLGSTLLADFGQVGADLSALPPEGVALRATCLLAAEDRLTPSSVAAGQIGDQPAAPSLQRPAKAPRARSAGRRSIARSVLSPGPRYVAFRLNGRPSAPVRHVTDRNSGSPCDGAVSEAR